MDWTVINHALLAHLPVASGLLLPLALIAAQRPGRGIRNWWTVCRYLAWMGFLGLLAALVTGILDSRTGLWPLSSASFSWVRWTKGPETLLFRHVVLGLACLPLAGLALWSMHRPRKDHESLGLLSLLLGLLWAGCLLATGRAGFRLAHQLKVPPAAAPRPDPVTPTLSPVREEASSQVPVRLLDYGALEAMHADPVKSAAHGGRWIRVWASADAAEAYRSGRPLPVGAWVVMSSQEDRWGRPGPDAGPLWSLEQKAAGPSFTVYWARVPLEKRNEFDGASRVYWRDGEAHLEACRACHASGLAESSQRSRWRAKKLTPGE